MVVQGGNVPHYYILVIRKFIDFMSLFRHSFPPESLEYATYSCVYRAQSLNLSLGALPKF